MKSFFKGLFGSNSINSHRGEGQPPTSPAAGQVFSFQTRPYTEFSPPETGRFAAIKILGINEHYVGVAVLDGIWSSPPSPAEVRNKSVICEHRFAHTGRPAAFGVIRQFWEPTNELDDFKFVMTEPLSRDQASFFDPALGYAAISRTARLTFANYAAEGEWRWLNDRESLTNEAEHKNAKQAAERAAKEERYNERLSKLTWEQLRSETPFSNWIPSPPYPPEEFATAARAKIRSSCEALEELGAKPRKSDVRAILKNTVIWFNEADEKAGGVIETEEREDICSVLEEMAHAAKQKSLVDEIDEWRDW